jgi:hypothetical protein
VFGDRPDTADRSQQHTVYRPHNAAAAQLIPVTRHEKAPDPMDPALCFALLLGEHLELDHVLDGVAPVVAL